MQLPPEERGEQDAAAGAGPETAHLWTFLEANVGFFAGFRGCLAVLRGEHRELGRTHRYPGHRDLCHRLRDWPADRDQGCR